ncbi:MAG: hypothetical protein QOJ99_336 [Bryobacterales bacterium]|jgi:hypothetical protein|nr:hypothetical protein [Bryobacterales bacterium]
MKTITLMFAAVAMTFAQVPAAPSTPAPAKDTTATSTTAKKHAKKHAKKSAAAAPAAAPAAPASK